MSEDLKDDLFIIRTRYNEMGTQMVDLGKALVELENKLEKQESKEIEITGIWYIDSDFLYTSGSYENESDYNAFETQEEAEKFRKYICVLRKLVEICKQNNFTFQSIIEYTNESYNKIICTGNITKTFNRILSNDDKKVLKDGLL